MGPGGGGAPDGEIGSAIDSAFGSFDDFKTKVNQAGATRFGSGWAWLYSKDGRLEIGSSPNQDSPIMDGGKPILGIDVWEHAYYLNYQNRPAPGRAIVYVTVHIDQGAGKHGRRGFATWRASGPFEVEVDRLTRGSGIDGVVRSLSRR